LPHTQAKPVSPITNKVTQTGEMNQWGRIIMNFFPQTAEEPEIIAAEREIRTRWINAARWTLNNILSPQ